MSDGMDADLLQLIRAGAEALCDPMAPVAEGMGLERIDGGFRVKETAGSFIDVTRQIYNWRVCRTPKVMPMTYDRAWCYAGTGPASFTAAVLAARAWDGGDETEPAGWNKNVQTGEWREPER